MKTVFSYATPNKRLPCAVDGTLVSKPGSNDRGKHFHLGLLSLMILGVFLSACMNRLNAGEITFERYEVNTGVTMRQTVLTGFLFGGAHANLIVVDIDENDGRRLRIYGFDDGAWTPVIEASLDPEVSFVDVATIGERERLITYGRGRLNWFDPESGSEHELAAVAAYFDPPRSGRIPHVDVTRDLNGDQLDDLVVPDVDGFRVLIQTGGGTFSEPIKIGPSTEYRTHGNGGYRLNPWATGRVHEMDYNRDGRDDLVFWNEDHFEVHHQDEHGLFAQAAMPFTTEVTFDSDELATLAAPEGVRGRRKDHNPSGELTGRVLHALTDMNGDGIADLVIFSLQGRSLWRMHSSYEVHFGAPMPGGTQFAQEVDAAIQVDGIPFGLGRHDFERNGQVDMMFTVINPGVFKAVGMIVGSLLTDSVALDLKFYRMDGNHYPAKPNATRKARAYPPGKSEERTHFAPVLIGDVNGDGHADLLLGRPGKDLRIFPGVEGPDLFARRSQKVAVAVPNEEYLWLVDLNRDGKQDVLMHHPSTIEPQRITLLLTR